MEITNLQTNNRAWCRSKRPLTQEERANVQPFMFAENPAIAVTSVSTQNKAAATSHLTGNDHVPGGMYEDA